MNTEQKIARQVHAQEHKVMESTTRDAVLDLEKTIARQVHTLHDAASSDGARKTTISEKEDLKRALGGLKVLEKGNGTRSAKKTSTIEHAAGRLNDSLSESSQHKYSEALQNLNHAQKALASPDQGKYRLGETSGVDKNDMDLSSSHRRRELSQKVCHGSASSFGLDDSLQEQIAHGAGESAAKGSLAVLEKMRNIQSRRSTEPGCSYSSFDLHNLSKGDNLILEEEELSDIDIDSEYCSEDEERSDDNYDVGIDDTTEEGKEKGEETPVKRHSREARERKKRMHETRKKREHEEHGSGVEKRHPAGQEKSDRVKRSDRVERTKRGGRRASATAPAASTAGTAGPEIRRAATTGGAGRGRRHDRTRDIAGKQLQQRMSLILPVEEEAVPVDDIVEERVKEDTPEDIARRAQIDALKKQALARGPSISTAIANKIRNDPALLEKFLLEIHEEEELIKELAGKKGPPSVINGVDGAKSEGRRGLGEKTDGKRKVRSSNRSSLKTSSAIKPGTYRSVIGSSSQH